jgi:PAS domain S-box-containing protein
MLDELIYHVPKVWYRIHWVVLSLINAVFLGGYFFASSTDNSELAARYGLNDALFYLTAINLVYLLIIYWLIARINLVIATFLGSMMLVLPMLNVLSQTEVKFLPYMILWLALGFLEGLYGVILLLGTLLITFIFLVMKIEFDVSNLTSNYIILMISAILTVVASYFFWRDKFLTESSERVKKLSGQLKSHEQQLEILVQSITDGIIAVDTTGKITLMNAAGSKLTAWPESEAVGFDATSVLRLIKDPKSNTTLSDSEHPFNQVLLRHEHVDTTLQLLDRQNKTIFISLAISPVIVDRTKKLSGAVGVFRDVSKEKEEEQQRAEFISTASHEMRTPVAAIEGYLALALNDKVSKIDNNAREYLTKAHLSTQHLGQLFQDLLTSAKAEDGRLTSHPRVIDMGELVAQLVEDLRFGAEKKGLAMELVINANTDKSGVIDTSGGMKTIQPLYFSYIDPDRVREVITNVFDNAVKYTSEGRITIGLTGDARVVQVKISDTGAGIPEEDLPHLFQKFYRVDNSATRAVGGTGLGLFICKKIIELYNGRIWAESKPGEGSTFYINLPRLSAERAEQLRNQSQINPVKA